MPKNLRDKLKNISGDSVVLTLMPTEKFEEANVTLLRFLLNKAKKKGGYISLNRSYQNMVKILNKQGVDTSKLFFIDCVTKGTCELKENCTFIGSPKDVTNIGIVTNKIIENEDYEFVVLDSINTLLLHNNPSITFDFVHSLISKVRINNMRGILLGLRSNTNRDVIDEIAQICDKIIDLTK